MVSPTGAADRSSGFKRILAVDDEPGVLSLVRATLEGEGFEVATAPSGDDALAWVDRHGLPHLGIFDLRMPGIDGLELARRVQAYSDLPVIMLTAVDEESTVVRAIDEVAEDYVKKPFSPKELGARVRRVMRRIGDFSYALAPITVISKELSIDFVHQTAVVAERTVSLTPTESKILHILTRAAPRTVTPDFLLGRIWPLEEIFEDTLRVHVHRLRQKIEADPHSPSYLLTHRGLGYSFVAGS